MRSKRVHIFSVLAALCAAYLVWMSFSSYSRTGKHEVDQVADPPSSEVESPSVGPATGETLDIIPLPPEGERTAEEEVPVEEGLNGDSCEEVSRQAEISTTTVYFRSGEAVDENACAVALRFMGPSVPVLPGLAGFDIPDLGSRSPRETLANEPDNPVWSRAMENRIFAEIPDLLDFPIFMVHAVCRSDTCGVLFAYADAVYTGGKRDAYAQQLAEALDFPAYGSGERRQPRTATGFTYIYLGNWEMGQQSEGAKPPPRSFEELIRENDLIDQSDLAAGGAVN